MSSSLTRLFWLLIAIAFLSMVSANPVPTNNTDLAVLSERALEKRARYGKATFFYVGLGNCGGYNKNTDYIVALATKTYAKGAHCNKQIKITDLRTGKTAIAKVRDSCPGCGVEDLDMSPSLFSHFEKQSKGVFNMKWWFI